MNNNFPANPFLNIPAFSRIFSNTSTSYKYLFFLSFLDKLKEDKNITQITFLDLAVGMLSIAWFPHQFFKLSLGVQDQCANVLDSFVRERKIIFEKGAISKGTKIKLQSELRDWLSEEPKNIGSLLDYVPYRLLSSFYNNELKGVAQHKRNKIIIKLANTSSIENIPLYSFSEKAININSRWRNYLYENMPVIEGWVHWNWCEYLQSRNPSIPAIPNKILPILKRISMKREIDYWKGILKHEERKCIYTKDTLNDFALDHFLPWSFVTHNQLWNLIPVMSSANSSKSNNLPSLSYLDDFIEEQFVGIQTAKKIYSKKKWQEFMQPYISDLHIASYDELLNQTVVEAAFKNTIKPLYEIASINGFSSGWVYQNLPKGNNEKIQVLNFSSEANDTDKYNSSLPLYSIEVAAGNFATSEVIEEPTSWLDISETNFSGSVTKDLFITKITGRSMEPTIADGSYCVFKYGVVGTRLNRIVLVKKDGVIDPDLQTSFTIKRYFSEKVENEEGSWVHKKIELRPDNPDYDVIEINEEDRGSFAIVAEFIQIIEAI